jgi:diacylglycerol kinase family enzyme
MSRTRGRPTARDRSIQIVATSGSGTGAAVDAAQRLREALRARGHQVTLEVFFDLGTLRRWAATGGARCSLVISIGGDGTQSTAAVAAVRQSIPFLPVPAGFGNLFARAFGHVPDVSRAVDLLEHGELVAADVGLRNGRLFLDQESFGVLPQIQASVEARLTRPLARWRRWVAYYQGAVRYLRDAPLPTLQVTVDGQVVTHDAAVVTVANVATYGPWLRLTPTASPVDGFFDVFVMRSATKRELLAKLLRCHLRWPATEPGTLRLRGRRVSVAAPQARRDALELIPSLLQVVVSPAMARKLERDVWSADEVSVIDRRLVA